MKSRTFNIMQYENHPETGEPLLNEETIKKALEHKSLKEWAYICHDGDVYSEKDELDNPNHVQGQTKPRHWHIVIKAGYAIDVTVIAKWFGIAENFVDVPKGAGAFLDCVQYLTHENLKQQGMGKRLYEDERVIANFDFRSRLDKRTENRLKYGVDLDPKDQMRHNVMYGGWTLTQCEESDPLVYMADMDRLKKYRLDYLQKRAPLPLLRLNYYVDGPGGIGKNTASRALAKSLYPDLADCDCYFEVGGDKVSFDGYDGQPVIIWNDRRARGFISTFGREETFDIFDSHPTNSKHSIKYGAVRLVNSVNIVNGVDSYQDFLNGLAGEYKTKDGQEFKSEDRGQSYRRFPIILCLRERDFDVLLNKGVAEGTREYEQYVGYKNLVGSFGEVAKKLEGRARDVVMVQMMEPALEVTEKVKQVETTKISNPEEIPEEFKQYGKPAEARIPEAEELIDDAGFKEWYQKDE